GGMALRWAVTGLLEAQKSSRRLKGYRELPALLRALDARTGSHENHRTVVEDVAQHVHSGHRHRSAPHGTSPWYPLETSTSSSAPPQPRSPLCIHQHLALAPRLPA